MNEYDNVSIALTKAQKANWEGHWENGSAVYWLLEYVDTLRAAAREAEAEAAEFLGVSEPTFRQVAESDETFPRRKIGGRYLYGRAALVEWVNSGRD